MGGSSIHITSGDFFYLIGSVGTGVLCLVTIALFVIGSWLAVNKWKK